MLQLHGCKRAALANTRTCRRCAPAAVRNEVSRPRHSTQSYHKTWSQLAKRCAENGDSTAGGRTCAPQHGLQSSLPSPSRKPARSPPGSRGPSNCWFASICKVVVSQDSLVAGVCNEASTVQASMVVTSQYQQPSTGLTTGCSCASDSRPASRQSCRLCLNLSSGSGTDAWLEDSHSSTALQGGATTERACSLQPVVAKQLSRLPAANLHSLPGCRAMFGCSSRTLVASYLTNCSTDGPPGGL